MSRLLVASLLLALALPSAASAQTQGDVVVTLVEVLQGETVIREDEEDLNRSLGATECADMENVTLRFRAQPVTAGTMFVDVWVGSSSQDCFTADARSTGDMRVCTHLMPDPMLDSDDGIFNITLAELLQDSSACNDGQPDVELNLWVFATGDTETTGEVSPGGYGFTTFGVDPTPPPVPSPSASSATGDTGIPVRWGDVGEANTEYFVYVDTNTDAGCAAGSAVLVPGELPPELPIDGVSRQRTGIDDTSANLNGESLGLAFGESALVGVVAVDQADNESALSSLVCITRVESLGFCGVYEGMGEESCPSGCSAGRGGRDGAGLAALLSSMGLLVMARRRRR